MGQVSVFSLWLVINQRQSLVAYPCLEILEIELKFKLFFFFVFSLLIRMRIKSLTAEGGMLIAQLSIMFWVKFSKGRQWE